MYYNSLFHYFYFTGFFYDYADTRKPYLLILLESYFQLSILSLSSFTFTS